jgi:GT2 family glycosyltransferase
MSNSENEKTPFFSVVIPTYERPEDLRQCLQALSPENQPEAPSYEIIVTDDSRSDLCRILVEKEFPQVSWGKGKQNGPAGNRNAGVSRAKGEWIVFIDDDCIAQTGYLSAYAATIKIDHSLGVLEGRIFPDRPRKTWAEGCPANETGGMFWTSNLCVKKSLFLELGGLDERFEVAFEDVDFAHRLAKATVTTTFVHAAAACHPWRGLRSGGKNWKRKGYELESLALFLEKHPEACDDYGSVANYLRNFCRIVTKDLAFCLFKLSGRGLDILFVQALNTLRTATYVRKLPSRLDPKT